jgi:hypothetical protein
VRQLDAGDAALFVHEPDNAREHVDVIVFPETEIFGADAALGSDRGRLGQHQARAADRAAAEMHEVPVIREAVGARVLAHRRDEHAIGKGDVADGERLEEVRHPHLS